MNRGIYLVANLKSQDFCENLIYSIKQSGCRLPIRLIHFGGEEVDSTYILESVELIRYEQFPSEAKKFISQLSEVLTDCPKGFLYRFAGWFLDWDEFIYADNDIVAMMNWETLFPLANGYDLLHADEEYKTGGKYNYNLPLKISSVFGTGSLETAFTAGHFLVRKNEEMISSFRKAIEFFRDHGEAVKKHDQAFLHIASLLGKWKMINLCREPYGWLSSWSGDYHNSLEIFQRMQSLETSISHIHYSGGNPEYNRAIEELLFSSLKDEERLKKTVQFGLRNLLGITRFQQNFGKIRRKLKQN